MLRSNLCDYSDANILVKGNISVNNTAGAAAANNTNNTQIDNVEYIDIVMPIYNLIEYSGNYSKTSGSLWQCCKDIPAVTNDVNIVIFNGANNTASLSFK